MTQATRRVRIARKASEAADICGFELVDANGRALPPFSAGAHIDVHLPNGMVRQYSLCNDPRETHRYQIAVLRDPASRGGSAAMHALAEGQVLDISDPRNHFALAHDASHHLLLAGGIGVTPLLCMAGGLRTSAHRSRCATARGRGNAWRLWTALAAATFPAQVQLHFDDRDRSQRLDLDRLLASREAATHVYVCGPTGFMDWVLRTARERGWAEDRLHREYFSAAPMDMSGDGAFEVQVASTGAVIPVQADQSVVAALAAHGIEVPVSCEQGVCGTCITRILEGAPLHRNVYFSDEEKAKGDQFTPCCSRAKEPATCAGPLTKSAVRPALIGDGFRTPNCDRCNAALPLGLAN